ncbi:MAG: O-linked N-acetylglucosamine transferase, SPINDLY family protein [Phormidium tanganyikae FI6-MK23]|jgi:predicted O-linked N-acetylglucosamine transferase (SPINDLY family)|nr:O-linked N-acetylglucosamine transferase, SPINDLY family protein [Phormidium tanganyikae FI6-MK23]
MTTSVPPSSLSINWQQQAALYTGQNRFAQAAALYEQAIETDPSEYSHYWHLGLLLLLQGQEEEAQTTWLFALSEIDADRIDAAVAELSQILHTAAERRTAKQDQTTAWAIRQHLRELCPDNIENLLQIATLSIDLNLLTDSLLEEIGLVQQLAQPNAPVSLEHLWSVFDRLLKTAPASDSLLAFVKVATEHLQYLDEAANSLISGLLRFGFTAFEEEFAIQLAECALNINPVQTDILGLLAALHHNLDNHLKAVEVAQFRYQHSESLIEKIFSNGLILRGLLGSGGLWKESVETADHHRTLLERLVEQSPTDVRLSQLTRLFNSSYHLAYLQDQPKQWRTLENQVIKLAQSGFQNHAVAIGKHYIHQKRDRTGQRLKVGYLSYCMATHSVGWLARWLLQHHDRDQIELHGYFLGYREAYDPLQAWYVDTVEYAHKFTTYAEATYLEIADQIYQDEIDILIDLDSITLDVSCQILSLKPAPIQATWLGWDASGLPTIDYFIADPYVLPDDAQSYYHEKIWRLPQTYIAVDGFEVDPPTLRREDLEIPDDAIVFLSAQRGYKRHQDHVRSQLKIINQVPNSYFLIKGLADAKSVQEFFLKLAEEEGVSSDRLRFLKGDPSCQTHRANLQIADVVLDTFPYNGATTTLETLWMEVPIVTRVGEQFAARNSYTMMMNASVTEGIASSDREYIEWGVRLGTDAALRQSVISKLHQSKRSSPLWNGKQFAREMEQAYQQMWATYLES